MRVYLPLSRRPKSAPKDTGISREFELELPLARPEQQPAPSEVRSGRGELVVELFSEDTSWRI